MAPCPKCLRNISVAAQACPHCGHPITEASRTAMAAGLRARSRSWRTVKLIASIGLTLLSGSCVVAGVAPTYEGHVVYSTGADGTERARLVTADEERSAGRKLVAFSGLIALASGAFAIRQIRRRDQ